MSDNPKGLFGSDFKLYFDKVPIIRGHWKGVKSIDCLPKSIPVRQFLIVNLSPSSHPGSHWVVLFRSHKDSLEIFNSLGFDNVNHIKPYFKFNFRTHLSYNNSAVQLTTTATCGFYCIYFAIFRLLNLDQPFDEILDEIFSNDLLLNENKVTNFCRHLLHISDESELLDF